MLPDLLLEIVRATSRVLSGRLLTSDQIGAVTGNVVGKHFTDWFGTPEDEREAAKRVEEAKDHLAKATRLIGSLKTDLDDETRKLEEVVADLQAKKNEADHYGKLAAASKELYEPLKRELREGLRRELEQQAAQGRRTRQALAFVGWIITLVLGAYLSQIITWVRGLLAV